MSNLSPVPASPFDEIRRVRADGSEFWSARDLMPALGYDRWENFTAAVERARITAENTGHLADDLFRGVTKRVSGVKPTADFHLSRFAAYLVAMNGDPRKPEVAAAQQYFAVRTREAEVAEVRSLTREQKLSLGFEAQQEVIEEQKAVIADQASVIAELEPAARHWDQIIARNGDVDVRNAAQWLSTVPGIDVGQNRLWAYLKQVRWVDKKNRPYQHVVERGLLASRYDGEWRDPADGRVHVKSTTMVRMKGLALLRKSLGPEEQLPAVGS